MLHDVVPYTFGPILAYQAENHVATGHSCGELKRWLACKAFKI